MPKRYAVLLSAETYKNQPPTPHCHADRELLLSALVDDCDYAREDIVSSGLGPDAHDPVSVVHAAIGEVKAKLQPGDTVIFYYAGHGVSVDGEPYLFLPSSDIDSMEKTGVPIRDVSNELRLDGNACFRIFDSCHSGIDVRDSDQVSSLVRGVAAKSPDGWITLAGCAADEKCHSSDTEGHGVFTYRLVQALQEIEMGKDVVPEALKVRTCELVAEWCADNGRQQRPTLIGTVHGNVSMGMRRAKKEVSERIKVDEAPGKAAAAVKARLATLQGSAPPASEEYWKRYKEAMAVLREHAEQGRDMLELFGVHLSEIKNCYLQDAANDLQQPLVDLVHQKGWRTLHTIKREANRNSSSYGSIYAITQGIATVKIERTAEQAGSSPAAVLAMQIPASGATPGLRLVHYLCPLQTRFIVYSRYIVTGVLNDDGLLANSWYRNVGMVDCGTDIRHHVEFVHKKGLEAYERACETNVAYLESEQDLS